MAGLRPGELKFRYTDNNGNPLVDGKVYTYISGTNTLQTTWADIDGNANNANPVILDARGEANIFLLPGRNYRFTVRDSNDALIDTEDNISGASPAPGSGGWVNIQVFGADPTGVADSTAAILAAMEEASTLQTVIYAPAGTYKITSTITNAGARSDFLGIVGDSSKSSIFSGETLTTNAFVFTDVPKATRFEHFTVLGPGPTAPVTSSGIQFLLSAEANIYGQIMTDVRVERFPTKGFYWQIPITTVFDQLVVQEIGVGPGFEVGPKAGPATFVGGTSTKWNGCYANNVKGDGYYFNAHGYATLDSCAADNCNTSYRLYRSFAMSITGCGSEVTTYVSPAVPGDALVLNECYGCSITGLWSYNLPNVLSRQVRVLSSTHCTISSVSGYTDNGVSPTFNAVVDGGSTSVLFQNNSPTLNETGYVSPTFTIDDSSGTLINIADGRIEGIKFDTPDIYNNSLVVSNGNLAITADLYKGLYIFEETAVDYPVVAVTNDSYISLGTGVANVDTFISRGGVATVNISGAAIGTGVLQVAGSVLNDTTLTLEGGTVSLSESALTGVKTVSISDIDYGLQTAITSADVAITGWSTSTINYVSGGNSAGAIGVNCTGSPSANPTVKVTFKSPVPAKYAFTPVVVATPYQDIAATGGTWQLTSQTPTDFTMTFVGTPVAGQSYGFNYNVFCL